MGPSGAADNKKKGGKPTPPLVRKRKKSNIVAKTEETVSWQSAISFDAPSTAALLRTILEDGNMKFTRHKSEKSYSQLYAVLPFPRVAYVFRFEITSPAPLVIDVYETHPATYGPMGFLEIPRLDDANIELARRILRELVKRLPRPPWKFTAAQRVQHGLMNPDILRAPKHWRVLGIAD